MFILLLCFSTRESRTRPLFYFNALALLFGILQGFMLSALYVSNPRPLLIVRRLEVAQVRSILEPSSNLSGLNLAINIVFLFSPLLVESILLLRLVAVFPSATHGRRTLSLVLGFPIAIRIGRLINMCLAIARSTASSSKLNNNTSQWWALLPFIRLEWFLALVDNTCVASSLGILAVDRIPPQIRLPCIFISVAGTCAPSNN
jgi:hypothetical protein